MLGVLAGYFKGWVDEAVQYLYTVLTSVPNVLLIAACVLMVQVFVDTHAEMFETGLERADLKMFLLCVILGLTGWATLCRLVRAETLKLRDLEFMQAAEAFGVPHLRTMARHIVPNVMHLVLITTVLNFSDLILYEAVLTYVGVGVDPSLNSFGGMINLARSEMSGDPLVWWSFVAAFGFMLALVLAANLFADGVRDAFDPRARAFRPRRVRRPRCSEGAHGDAGDRPTASRARCRRRPRQGGRRPEPGDRARRDLCAGGRVGLRQEHDRAGADASAARQRRGHRRRRSRWPAPTCWRCRRARCARCAAAASA